MKKVMKNIFLKLMVNILKEYEFQNDLPSLSERMKIEKVVKLEANLHHKTEQVIYIRNQKQAFNHGLIPKKVPIVIKFNQNAWLKPYIDMNTDLRKKANIEFDFF